MKKIDEYMTLPYRLEISPDTAEDGFVVSYPELPGCITCADTMEAVIANALDAKRAWLEAALESGTYIPVPSAIEDRLNEINQLQPEVPTLEELGSIKASDAADDGTTVALEQLKQNLGPSGGASYMTNFDDFLADQLRDPEVKAEWDALETEFSIMQAMIDARWQAGLTQKQLSERTGIAQSDISKLESGNGNPSLKTLQRLASGLGMHLEIVFRPSNSSQ